MYLCTTVRLYSGMDPAVLISIPFGVAIGLIVGMVGGGGAVLAVPVLVYAVGLDVHEATTVSLAVVAAAATTGAIGQTRRGAVCWSSAAWFAGAAALGSLLGAVGNQNASGSLLLFAFAGVMLLAARATWQRAGQPAAGVGGCPKARARVLVPVGLVVGSGDRPGRRRRRVSRRAGAGDRAEFRHARGDGDVDGDRRHRLALRARRASRRRQCDGLAGRARDGRRRRSPARWPAAVLADRVR